MAFSRPFPGFSAVTGRIWVGLHPALLSPLAVGKRLIPEL